ncbi:MAG: GNAT family N-acetyltransferase [Flavobacteriales bacterium]|nr:GNAT family N-acetyltransferase [Flavobacteriales bacterium]MBK6945557.1 GNAT family N-acetyltransferase [Flavobacteriales bacterium]MBK7241673.1 GNAT family N-acetyltransferase [Flavobacteriales bacterium]MBK7296341.1 GNAT family N-acetyltransferase [Flavobacteriales bacterium]MBK9534887.1 GNAT family N-acetyltransferase [Flavobacteriales bacterium]
MSADDPLRRIRICTQRDISVIRHIAVVTWPVAYAKILSKGQLHYMLDLMYSERVLQLQFEQGQQFLLSEEGARPLGFASVEHNYKGTRKTRLHKLYVLPETQGTGVGKQLLDAVIRSAEIASDERIELNVNKFNTAKEFYLRSGFTIVRDEVLDIGEGFVMDDHVMELQLNTV